MIQKGKAGSHGLGPRYFVARRIVGPLYKHLSRIRRFQSLVIGLRKGNLFVYFRPFALGDVFVAAGLISRGLYEPYVRKTLATREGETLVNAGAHIGYYVLTEARSVGDSGRIVAIEPHPKSFEILTKNVRANSLHNVDLVNAALSSVTGTMMLQDFSNKALGTDPAFSRTVEIPNSGADDFSTVKAYSLDDLLKELGILRVDWLILDVEGQELSVLKGAEKALRNGNTKLIVEISSPQTISYLIELGYERKHLFDSPSGMFGVDFYSKSVVQYGDC